MKDGTIIRLAQLVTACVCVLAGAGVAKAAVSKAEGRWWQIVAGIALSIVFVYAALKLSTRGFYVTYG